jgi:hypothetical protein
MPVEVVTPARRRKMAEWRVDNFGCAACGKLVIRQTVEFLQRLAQQG